MHKNVVEYVSKCDTCQLAKSQTMSPAGLLQPLPIPSQVWEDASMDFVDGLPGSDNHTTIMVVVDRLSKSAHLIPLIHPYTASTVAAQFIANVIKLHGIPQSILNDRDPVFLSNFWKEFWRLSGTQLCMSTAYHPPKWSTDASNSFFVVSYSTDLNNGAVFCRGLSIGTIRRITHQLV